MINQYYTELNKREFSQELDLATVWIAKLIPSCFEEIAWTAINLSRRICKDGQWYNYDLGQSWLMLKYLPSDQY